MQIKRSYKVIRDGGDGVTDTIISFNSSKALKSQTYEQQIR